MKARPDRLRTAGWLPALFVIALAPRARCEGAESSQPLKPFESSKYHFTVQYPASWYPLAGTTDILDITNFERTPQLPGIALKVGGAEITVSRGAADIRSAEQWVLRDLPDTDAAGKDFAVEQVDLPATSPPERGCRTIKQVSWRDEVAPDAYLAETNFYCSTAAGFYKIALSNWDGDPAESKLRVIAIQIARSLRTH